MNELKDPEIVNNGFEANGRKYHISTKISIDRYREYEKLQLHVVFGCDVVEMSKTLDEIDDMLNKVQFVDCAVKVRNLRQGIDYIADKAREQPLLYLCGLFINRDDEDVRWHDQAVIESKIQDWKTEGISQNFFFQRAKKLIKSLAPDLEEDLKNISGTEKENSDPEPTNKSSGK